ncbi:MAG: carbohydrate ABC transporter permease [Epulopiscium sp.]|nr:carbohydrate ABC transporter permease [Candidatus Epulonipiscium sp.]
MSDNNVRLTREIVLPESNLGKKKISVGRVFLYIGLIILAVITFFPFYIMIINASHTSLEISTKLNLLPGNAFISNILRAQRGQNVINGFKNSLIVAVSTTIIGGYIGALTAYGFSKYHFPGNKVLFWVVIGSMMFPAQLGLIGYYQVCNSLGLINNHLALILPNSAMANLVFFVKMYMDSAIPDSIIESAKIDGCSEFHIFNRIVLPISIPSIAAMCILNFISVWNNLIQASVVFTEKEMYTIPIIMQNVRGFYRNDLGAVYGVIALSIIPIMIVFAIGSKYIIGGMVAGSVKE